MKRFLPLLIAVVLIASAGYLGIQSHPVSNEDIVSTHCESLDRRVAEYERKLARGEKVPFDHPRDVCEIAKRLYR